MFFRNDELGPLTPDEQRAMHAVFQQFETQDEVRLGEDVRYLAPILNNLTQAERKFYLVHLPDGLGWVLRRHRPTGVYLGRAVPAPVKDAPPEATEMPSRALPLEVEQARRDAVEAQDG